MSTSTTTYGQYCPISRALELIGERWSLLIMRDLIVGSTRFNDLARGLPGLSRSLLSKRLGQFQRAGLVERDENEYVLTEMGRSLEPVIFGLGAWGARWAFGRPRPEELDAELLVWWMHRRIDTTGFPGKRQVFHVCFSDDPRQFWIVVENGEPSVCLSDPGYDITITITSDLATLYRVWSGELPVDAAQRAGRLQFDGRRALTRLMPQAMLLSPARVVSAATPSGSDGAP
jgi:DNA-binding HxlR family transcriptional regulator